MTEENPPSTITALKVNSVFSLIAREAADGKVRPISQSGLDREEAGKGDFVPEHADELFSQGKEQEERDDHCAAQPENRCRHYPEVVTVEDRLAEVRHEIGEEGARANH